MTPRRSSACRSLVTKIASDDEFAEYIESDECEKSETMKELEVLVKKLEQAARSKKRAKMALSSDLGSRKVRCKDDDRLASRLEEDDHAEE